MLSASDGLNDVGVLGEQRAEASPGSARPAACGRCRRPGTGRGAPRRPARPRRTDRAALRRRPSATSWSTSNAPPRSTDSGHPQARQRGRGQRRGEGRARDRPARAARAGRARPAPRAAGRRRRRCGPSGRRPTCVSHWLSSGHSGTRPSDGPQADHAAEATPGCAATRPCRSRRRAAPSRRPARTPLPRCDPPAERVGSTGLRVVPKTGLNVCDPAANSGTLVLPIEHGARRRRIRSTSRSSWSGDVVGEERRAVRRAPARQRVGVLHREGQAVQRARRTRRARGLVGGCRGLAGPLLVERDDRVELGVALGDPGQVQVEQLARGDVARARTAAACSRAVESTVRSVITADDRRSRPRRRRARRARADGDTREELLARAGGRTLAGPVKTLAGHGGSRRGARAPACDRRWRRDRRAREHRRRRCRRTPPPSASTPRSSIRWPTPPTMPPTTASAS